MRKSLILLLTVFCCAYANSSPSQPGLPPSLQERADTYKKNGRYREALSFYRDIAMNPA